MDDEKMPELAGDDPAWELLALLGNATEADAVIVRLAELVLAEARGERAIVAALDGAGRVLCAWGVDLDGLPIARAEARIDAASLAAARRRGAFVYQPDVASRAGRGARLVVAGERAAVVVEHRFLRGAFDHVSERAAARWGVLAAVAVRVAGAREGSNLGSSDNVRERPHVAPRASPNDARAAVEAALGKTGGNISQAAVLLGLSRHGLKKRMVRLGLRTRAAEQA